MTVAYILVIIISVISLIATLMVAGKGDEGYSNSTKRNITNLALIYAVVIILSIISVAVYIRWFA
ncbi:hypothetical protein ACN6MY_12215 [Peribacillus sp. B-H-3]|jgi:hypothetical protein|uniref:hypothetical protein n=1 Tax=Peribacillus sp. B-H-3 TaxID=3400420 RepID=UPI003B0115D4